MSPSDFMTPNVPEQTFDAKMSHALQVIWATAQSNKRAFTELRAASKEGLVGELCHPQSLEHSIRSLQPQFSGSLDDYTLELAQNLWNLAITSPECLRERGRRIYMPPFANKAEMALNWSIYNLKRNGLFRTRTVGSKPISTLPNEILAMVFQELRQSLPSYTSAHCDTASYLPLRLVCKRWRFVIDTTGSLWARMIIGYGVHWTRRALDKSRAVELDIRAHAIPIEHSVTCSAFMSLTDLHRVRTLDVHSSWRTLALMANILSSSDAPLLQSLSMRNADDPDESPIGQLPLSIFSGRPAPRLRNLILSDWNIPPASPVFMSPLVCIELTCCTVWPSLESLIDGLQSLPTLEIFCWDMPQRDLLHRRPATLFPEATFLLPVHQTASLPRLKKLTLSCPSACFAAIMACMVIPASCIIYLLDDYTFSGEKWHDRAAVASLSHQLDSSLGAHLSKSCDAGIARGFDTLRISEYAETQAGRGALHIEGLRSRGSPSTFSIIFFVADVFQGGLEEGTLLSLLRIVLGWRIFDNVALNVETNHVAMGSKELWKVALESIATVSHVQIENSADLDASVAVEGLSRALLETSDLAPQLLSITLFRLNLDMQALELLAAAVEHRSRRNVPAVLLRTISCEGIQKRELALLEDRVRRCGGTIESDSPRRDPNEYDV